MLSQPKLLCAVLDTPKGSIYWDLWTTAKGVYFERYSDFDSHCYTSPVYPDLAKARVLATSDLQFYADFWAAVELPVWQAAA